MLTRFSKLAKAIRKAVVVQLALVGIFSILTYRPTAVMAADPLEEQLKDLQTQLADIKKKQKELKDLLSAEDATQSALRSQISTYNNSIYQTELLIEESETQINLYSTEIDLLSQEIVNTQKHIELTSHLIFDRQSHLSDVSFTIYRTNHQSSFDQLLQGNPIDHSMYKTHFYDISREQAQELLSELEALKADQEAQKVDLEDQKAKSEKTRADLEDQKALLEEQKNGLAVQKSERERYLAASKGREAELDAQKKELDKIARQIEREMNAIELELLSRVVSGSAVAKGKAIAQIGRTGHVRSSHVPGCPYPHPVTYPKYGSHLHFVMYLGNSRVNPLNYLGDTFGHPTPGAIITQGYKTGHQAIDYAYWGPDATFGKPIYASCSGTISYHTSPFNATSYGYPCGPFPDDPAHFYKLVCDEKYNGSTVTFFGWHIRAR